MRTTLTKNQAGRHPPDKAPDRNESQADSLLDRSVWTSRAELSSAMFEWIEAFYNPTRRHTTLGNLSPVEFQRLHIPTATAA